MVNVAASVKPGKTLLAEIENPPEQVNHNFVWSVFLGGGVLFFFLFFSFRWETDKMSNSWSFLLKGAHHLQLNVCALCFSDALNCKILVY